MDTRMQKEGSQYGLAPGTASYPRTVSQVHAPDHLQQQLLQQNSGDAAAALAEAASPISSRPPAPGGATFVELTPGAGGIPEDDVFAAEDSERGTTAGNRWPRQETLALLKIRSEMDATFREASLRGPLWEDVSRKLAELAYIRSAKKCKEKFENVHKYYKRCKEKFENVQKCYKRTKEGRAGEKRPVDGDSGVTSEKRPHKKRVTRRLLRPSIPSVEDGNKGDSQGSSDGATGVRSDPAPPSPLCASVLASDARGVAASQGDAPDDLHVVDLEGSRSGSPERVLYESPSLSASLFQDYELPDATEMATWMATWWLPDVDEPYIPSQPREEINVLRMFENLIVDEVVPAADPCTDAAVVEEDAWEAGTGTTAGVIPVSAGAAVPDDHGSSEGSFSVGSGKLGNRRVKMLESRLKLILTQWVDEGPPMFLADAPFVQGCLQSLGSEGVNVDVVSQYVERLLDIGRKFDLASARSSVEQAEVAIKAGLKALEESCQDLLSRQQSLTVMRKTRLDTESRMAILDQEIAVMQARRQEMAAFLSADEPDKREAELAAIAEQLGALAADRATLEAKLGDAAHCEVMKAATLRELETQAREFLQGAMDVFPS